MIAKIHSMIPCGFDARLVEVEGDMNRGLPTFNIVGMANKTINEAKERVRSALVNSGFSFPDKKSIYKHEPRSKDYLLSGVPFRNSQQLWFQCTSGKSFELRN